jgi:hypothetical protein
VGEQRSRASPSVKPALTNPAQGRERLHRASLSSSARRKVAARATRKCPKSRAVRNLGPRTIGSSRGRVGEQRSRAGPSVQPALTGQAQGRERLYRASLSGSAGRKVAARATRKCPKSRALSNQEAAGYRRFNRSRGAVHKMRRPQSRCIAWSLRPPS